MGVPETTSGGVPGTLVSSRYRLVESIGQGGMGRVWRAADEILDRQVAVKEMRIDGLDPEDSRVRRQRTLREARATARIDHPNVVRVYDVVDEGERLWIVMELVDGRSLEDILREDGPLDVREAARIGLQLAAALEQVHAGGVLHRDIKPANVLVERGGGHRVVLTDFGIAAIQDAEALTMAGMLVGSPDYMAPERVSGRPQGPPSDLWSLGATLCAALGGRSPFYRSTTLATLHAVLYEEPEIPAAAGGLRGILTALLEKEPSVRPGLEAVATVLEPLTTAGIVTVLMEPGPGPETEEELPAPDAHAPDAHAPDAHAPEAHAPDAHAPEAHAPDVEAPEGHAHAENASSEAPSEGTPELPSQGAHHPHPHRTRRRIGMAVAGAALAGAVAGLVVPALGGSPDGDEASPSPSATTSAPAGTPSSPPPTVGGTSRPPSASKSPELPAGARREAGLYAWVPPEGWQRVVRSDAKISYSSPDRAQEIIANAAPARGDLLDQWLDTERRSTGKGRDYRRIRLEETTFRGAPAVVWEYTVTADERPWHVRLLGFRSGGISYEIDTWYHPGIEERALPVYEGVKDTFTPLRTSA
ncbi:serine/threonine-protein kinase [Streptomyces poonensis]|uniref:non-specific serine/threonine protein kinase n=3 Tax=Streptomyces poonensis TaxID=68255 RepID=A0A918PQ01_9ACTN|nr:serine/threonine-protein kinase [Streptomyces poonensis]GGZ18243.1 hypothetical protein GCM10010365_43010 [Streptomyces poonensis]